MNPEPALRFMLRFFGTMSLLAIPFIFVPYSVMDDIHQQLQLGKLPDEQSSVTWRDRCRPSTRWSARCFGSSPSTCGVIGRC